MRTLGTALAAMVLVLGISQSPAAVRKFVAFNETASTVFTGLYLAPAGTTDWGPNQVLSEPDKTLDASERLTLTGVSPGRFDVKLVDGAGDACILRGVDLRRETSFEIRDADLAACQITSAHGH